MLKSKLIFLLLIFPFFLHAQQVNLAWGPEKKLERSSEELGYVGRAKGNFYTLRREKKTMFLAKTRISDMSMQAETPIKWNQGRKNDGDDNLTFKSFRLFKKNFIFYFEDYNKRDDQQRLYAQKLDFDGKPFDNLTELTSRTKERRSKDGSFALDFSEDSTHFVVTTNPNFEKYNNEEFNFKIFNNNLEKLYDLQVTLPYKDNVFELTDVRLSKKNVIYMLARIEVKRKDRKDDEASYYYELISIDPKDKGKVKEFELKLDRKYIGNIDLILDNKDNLKCFGFYADMRDNGKPKDGLNGIFYFSLKDGKITNTSIKEFDMKLVFEMEGRKRAVKSKGLEANYVLKNFFNKPDGGMMMLAEEAFVRVVTRSNGRSTTTTNYYNNNSILAVNIDASGNIVWYSHVPKKQVIANDNRFNSFHSMFVNNKVYIIYNDTRSNAEDKNFDETMRNYFKCVPVLVTINADGKIDKRMLSDNKKDKYLLKPNVSDKISNNEAFFYSDRLSRACCVVGSRKAKTQRYGILAIK